MDRVSLRTVRRILAALDASVGVAVRWRAGSLDRLLDEDHALLVGRVAGLLRAGGWSVETEVTYAHYGERGSYDILAYHSGQRVLLVVEIKSDLASAEQTLRKLDEKVRLAPVVARTRFDGPANGVARLLAMPDDRTLRRHVARHTALFDVALPDRSVAARRWIRAPAGRLAAVWFVPLTNGLGTDQRRGGRKRVRAPRRQARSDQIAA